MNSLDWCCLVCLILSTAHGAWKGWTAQGFYLLMAFALYILALKISNDHVTSFFLSQEDISLRNLMVLEIASPLLVIVFFLLRRFHNLVFATHPCVPGHHVVGAIFGFSTGFFALLYLFAWIDLTDMKSQAWWTSSLEYQVSESTFELITTVYKTVLLTLS